MNNLIKRKVEITTKVAEQKTFAFEFQVCCSFDRKQNKYYEYFGVDASGPFVATITKVCKEIANESENRFTDHGLTQEQVKKME